MQAGATIHLHTYQKDLPSPFYQVFQALSQKSSILPPGGIRKERVGVADDIGAITPIPVRVV
jgi:hypothetical protein